MEGDRDDDEDDAKDKDVSGLDLDVAGVFVVKGRDACGAHGHAGLFFCHIEWLPCRDI